MALLPKMLKFACNIGTAFPQTVSLMDRLDSAKRQGFTCIEVAFPYTWSLEEWKGSLELHPLDVVLINTPIGPNGQLGLAACQNKEKDFIAGVEQGIKYCKALNCSQLHVMAGTEEHFDGQFHIFIYNMRKASDLLRGNGISCLLETISAGVIPGYYLNEVHKTIELILDICCENVFFQFDVFHLNMLGLTDDEILTLFDQNFHLIKHIQVAQTPGRNQVDMAGGVDYSRIFNHFILRKYDGIIGLEFKPSIFDDKNSLNTTLAFLSKF